MVQVTGLAVMDGRPRRLCTGQRAAPHLLLRSSGLVGGEAREADMKSTDSADRAGPPKLRTCQGRVMFHPPCFALSSRTLRVAAAYT